MKKFFVFIIMLLLINVINVYSGDIFDNLKIKEELAKETLEEKKKDPAFHIEEGDKAYEEKDYKKAADSYYKAYELDTSKFYVKVYYYKANLLATAYEFKIPLFIVFFIMICSLILRIISGIMKGAANRVKNNKTSELLKLKNSFIAGKYDEVLKNAPKILERPYDFTIPDKFFIKSTLAKTYYKKAMYQQAKKNAVEALKLKSGAIELHDILCEIFLKLNDTSPRAIKEYEIKLKKSPNNTKILNILFDYYYAKKDIGEVALNVYSDVYKYSKRIEAADMLCLRGIRKKDTSLEIIPIYEKVYNELRKDDINLKMAMLRAYYQNKQFDKAYPFVKEILSMKEYVESKDLHKVFFDCSKALNKMDDLNEFYGNMKKQYPDSIALQNIFDEHDNKQEGVEIEKSMNDIDKIDKGIKICPVCAHINIQDAKFCEKCGKPLNIE